MGVSKTALLAACLRRDRVRRPIDAELVDIDGVGRCKDLMALLGTRFRSEPR